MRQPASAASVPWHVLHVTRSGVPMTGASAWRAHGITRLLHEPYDLVPVPLLPVRIDRIVGGVADGRAGAVQRRDDAEQDGGRAHDRPRCRQRCACAAESVSSAPRSSRDAAPRPRRWPGARGSVASRSTSAASCDARRRRESRGAARFRDAGCRSGRDAEDAFERRLGPVDLADVGGRKLVDARPGDAHHPHVGEHVALAVQVEPRQQRRGAAAPQQPLPRQRDWSRSYDAGFPKLTFGTCFASGGASKNGYSLKPNSFAVMFAGNCRRAVLYSCTRSL